MEQTVAALAAEGVADFAIILEGGWARDALQLPPWFSGIIETILADIDAQVPIITSCTTMPKTFSNCIEPRKIAFTNRNLVDQVQANRNDRRVIYGDWASTRLREQSGGGGFYVPPRIDYPQEEAWWIYRNPNANWTFQTAAAALVADAKIWDGSTGQWGE